MIEVDNGFFRSVYYGGTRHAGNYHLGHRLGINIIRDKETKEPKVVPTKEDVLRQIRHIKRIAPDMPGIAFFTSYSAAPGVAEYADELCGEYFVKPLLTIHYSQEELDAAQAQGATLDPLKHNLIVLYKEQRAPKWVAHPGINVNEAESTVVVSNIAGAGAWRLVAKK